MPTVTDQAWRVDIGAGGLGIHVGSMGHRVARTGESETL
ncbi:hypothetical protein L083_2756 [Actinoplanes sp. N902-109]|nr:hypothetical protein L083_2756 [Actinoplanes sp. N902-109]